MLTGHEQHYIARTAARMCCKKQRDAFICCCIGSSTGQIVWPKNYANFDHWRPPKLSFGAFVAKQNL